MEYYQYFLLRGSPFQPASPRNAVYFSPTHLEGLTTLEAGLTGELTGLTMLTGEAGTGKTTLIYALLQRDYKRVRIARVDDPKLSFLEMLQVIMPQLNLYTAGTTKVDYLKTIDHLLDLHGKDERIAIIIDEAQVASDEVLDELRLFSNRGQRDERRLQLILVGQPELTDRLKKPQLRQLNQRISTRGVLRPLNPRESLMYVECLLSAQGSQTSAIFDPRALERLLAVSDGIPRKINMLCHTAMMAAFYQGDRKVSVGLARKVAKEYLASVGRMKGPSAVRIAAVASTAIAALLLAGMVFPNAWPGRMLNRAGLFRNAVRQQTPPAAHSVTHQKSAAPQSDDRSGSAVQPSVPESRSATEPAPANDPSRNG